MSDVGSFHGWYSADRYVLGETQYWWLKEQVGEEETVTIGFPWLRDDTNRTVIKAQGEVTKVYRDMQTPYVELGYLYYGDINASDIHRLIFKLVPGNPNIVDLPYIREVEKLRVEAGIEPDLMYVKGPVAINLATYAIDSFQAHRRTPSVQ